MSIPLSSLPDWIAAFSGLILIIGPFSAWSIHMVAENKDLKMEVNRLREKIQELQK